MHHVAPDQVRTPVSVIDRRHHHDVPSRQRPAHTLRDSRRFESDAEGIGADGQMRPMLFEHSDREDEQRLVAIERVDLRPVQFLEFVDASVLGLTVRGDAARAKNDHENQGSLHGVSLFRLQTSHVSGPASSLLIG